MHKKIIFLLTLFTTQVTITSNWWTARITNAQDCLNSSNQAEKKINQGYSNGYFLQQSKKQAQERIHHMRTCKCADRAAALDPHTDLHRRFENKCVELSHKAQHYIDTNDPRAIPIMQVIEALGCRHIYATNNPTLQHTRQQAIMKDSQHHPWWKQTETDKGKKYRLLREVLCEK